MSLAGLGRLAHCGAPGADRGCPRQHDSLPRPLWVYAVPAPPRSVGGAGRHAEDPRGAPRGGTPRGHMPLRLLAQHRFPAGTDTAADHHPAPERLPCCGAGGVVLPQRLVVHLGAHGGVHGDVRGQARLRSAVEVCEAPLCHLQLLRRRRHGLGAHPLPRALDLLRFQRVRRRLPRRGYLLREVPAGGQCLATPPKLPGGVLLNKQFGQFGV
mmetsp:Transcript_101619/g.270264  ORF Transcript_101619/g.270264 Transcript_101619/m.270264 type:complete len:212 (-) Transcript_101619:57-692(-)